MKVLFEDDVIDQYDYWDEIDKKIKKKIKALIKECQRTPYEGTGKPEPLKKNLSGYYSRRINDEHRLVYKVENDTLYIKSCRGHYEE
ncbi:toxin YoeB [Spirochaetia bacterium]|nr:toxin YoeB [Spirochaetia bacterium]